MGVKYTKPNKSDKERRIYEVYCLITQGYSNTDIRKYCAEKFKILSNQSNWYIDSAMKMIHEENIGAMEDMRVEANNRLNFLYKNLVLQKRYKEAGTIQGLKNKINGLEIKNIKVDHSKELDNDLSLLNKLIGKENSDDDQMTGDDVGDNIDS